MQYTDIEQKLIRLGLDSAAHDGEQTNAGAMLIKALRKRGVHADQVIKGTSQPQPTFDHYRMYLEEKARADKLHMENLWLKGKLAAATKPVDPTPTSKPKQPRRPKHGYQALSRMERDLLFRVAQRAGKDQEGRSLHGVEKPTDHQIMQRLMKKGYAEKRHGGLRGWHGLTEKGVLYYKQYGHWN